MWPLNLKRDGHDHCFDMAGGALPVVRFCDISNNASGLKLAASGFSSRGLVVERSSMRYAVRG